MGKIVLYCINFNLSLGGQTISKYLSRLVILFFIFSLRTAAQNFSFGSLSVENGLSNNAVNCLLQDHLGFIWFGTDDGLNRFDGYDIKVYRNNLQDTTSISDNNVWSLFEDRSGFMWIGTNSGEINRYNPRTDKFEHWDIKSENINENRITCISEDKDGYLWIGTYKKGLYRFNASANPQKLEHWQPEQGNPYSLSNYWVTSILQDQSGDLWIGTYNGLNKYNPGSPGKPFIRYYCDPKNSNSLSDNLVWDLTSSEFEPELILISTLEGLTKYNSATKIFNRFKLPDNSNIQWANSTSSVIEQVIGGEQILWIGTYGGLVQINLSTGKYERFLKDDHNPFGIVSNQIDVIIKDSSNVVWIATGNGVNFISPKSMKFNYLSKGPGKSSATEKLKYKSVKAITQTSDGTLWFGTDEGLFNIKNINNNAFTNIPLQLSKLNIWSLSPGNSNDLLIGTFGLGVKQFDLKTNSLKSWNLKTDNSAGINSLGKELPYDFVKTIYKDRKGNIWFGFWGAGLARYSPQTKKYQYWQNENNPLQQTECLSYNDVWVIFEDSRDRIWIGTNGGGLNLFQDKDGGKFYCLSKDTPLKSKKNNELLLSDNNINSICESTRGKYGSNKEQSILWVGTTNGLNKLLIKNSTLTSGMNSVSITNEKNPLNDLDIQITYYTAEDGLPDNAIKSILEDENGNLWIGTNSGISVFDISANTFINFTTSDGLNGIEFNSNASFRSSGELMFFGGTAGVNVFDPKTIKQSEYSPPVIITDFQIFNQRVTVGEESPLKTNIALAKEIILSYDQNVFSFQFSSLDFSSPQSNQYAYMMEGFDKDWIYSGSRRFVTYTNLEPGTYIFIVKATNNDGVWSKNKASLKVIINPPWWKTGWAYSLYIILIVVGLLAIRRFHINRAELRNELKMREFEAKKHQELEKLKSRFFANLSHEFRTPLMLIKGPVEQLINEQSMQKSGQDAQGEQLQMIQRNSRKLQELIDQLLELSQLEAASIPLKAKQENLITVLRGLVSSFESLASQKNIKLVFNNHEERLCVWIDRDKFEKIINNLLSNAFKFTNEKGRVSVSIGLSGSGFDGLTENEISKQAEIKISDTGIGIPEDQLDKIFNRFYQVDDSSRRVFGGSGIGLALVKELVELHKWKIAVQSEIDRGTEFTMTIPLGDSYLEENEKANENPFQEEDETERIVPDKKISNEIVPGVSKKKSFAMADAQSDSFKNASILIVEDSSDVRKYLSDLLKSCYNLSEAENGEEGLIIAVEKMPDLIISDIMMPYMDGIEFCRRIKTNWETSHIPVILLTAKALNESKIEGLETGADDYLTKPFDSKELFIRIKNLLVQRKRLKEKFSREINITADAVTANSLDNEFLDKAFNVVKKNLANTEFDSVAFAKEMFVSRSQLHRKIMAVTGQPSGEFIRSYRLKRAAQLLLEKRLSITQVAFEVGFSDPSYFTKAFRQQFGCLPSELSSKAQLPAN